MLNSVNNYVEPYVYVRDFLLLCTAGAGNNRFKGESDGLIDAIIDIQTSFFFLFTSMCIS